MTLPGTSLNIAHDNLVGDELRVGFGADAAELPVSTESGRNDLFTLGRLSANIRANGSGTFDDVVRQSAEAFHLHLDDVAREYGARECRRTRKQHVTGNKRDRARNVCIFLSVARKGAVRFKFCKYD